MARIDGGWGFTYWQKDRLFGTSSADEIRANGGDDFVDGGGGADQIWLGEGDDTAEGGAGRDTIFGDDGDDELKGEENSDVLNGGNGNDTLSGGEDHDTLFGSAGDDRLDGGSGQDLLNGGRGDDAMSGGSGDDVFTDYTGANSIRGGTDVDGGDVDTLDLGMAARVNVNLAAGTMVADDRIATPGGGGYFVQAGISTVSQIEKVIGSFGGDALTGSGANETLFGGGGDDTIAGGGGDDVLSGGIGFDSLTGGTGRDAFLFREFTQTNSSVSGARDLISDFNVADDTLQFDNAFFTALGANGPLSSDAFHVNTLSAAPNNRAADTEDRLIYDAFRGDLYYDPDGTGAADAVWIARFENRPTLTFDDIQII